MNMLYTPLYVLMATEKQTKWRKARKYVKVCNIARILDSDSSGIIVQMCNY